MAKRKRLRAEDQGPREEQKGPKVIDMETVDLNEMIPITSASDLFDVEYRWKMPVLLGIGRDDPDNAYLYEKFRIRIIKYLIGKYIKFGVDPPPMFLLYLKDPIGVKLYYSDDRDDEYE